MASKGTYDPKVNYVPAKSARNPRKRSSAFLLAQTKTRRVLEHCIDETKKNRWYAQKRNIAELTPVTPFLPHHDFQRDNEYLQLSRRLTYRDIEIAKSLSLGQTLNAAARDIYPDVNHRVAWQRVHPYRKPEVMATIHPLVEYFRKLHGVILDPSSFSVDEAFRNLVQDVRAAKPGKERTELTMRLVGLIGLEKELAKHARKNIGMSTQDDVPSLDRARAGIPMSTGSFMDPAINPEAGEADAEPAGEADAAGEEE